MPRAKAQPGKTTKPKAAKAKPHRQTFATIAGQLQRGVQKLHELIADMHERLAILESASRRPAGVNEPDDRRDRETAVYNAAIATAGKVARSRAEALNGQAAAAETNEGQQTADWFRSGVLREKANTATSVANSINRLKLAEPVKPK